MSRYGHIRESNETPEQFRVASFIQSMGRIDFGNCGVPTVLQEYVKNNRGSIEDIFIDNDSVYILPRTRESASELFNLCRGEKEDDEEDYWGIADEINWLKLGDRYWLSLWWD